MINNNILTQIKSVAVDQDELNRLFDDKAARFKELSSFIVDKFAEFHSILSEEQRESLARMIAKHGTSSRRRYRRHRRR
jgi:hypothetical protein